MFGRKTAKENPVFKPLYLRRCRLGLSDLCLCAAIIASDLFKQTQNIETLIRLTSSVDWEEGRLEI